MFQFGGLGALFGGLSPPKLPCNDGTGFRFRTGVLKFSLAMYSFSISIDEHVPLTLLMTKRLWKITRMIGKCTPTSLGVHVPQFGNP